MKKQILSGVFLLFMTSLGLAQNLPIVQVVNNTGYDVYAVFIVPAGSEELGEDVLEDFGDEILRNGDDVEVLLHTPLSAINTYNFILIDEDADWYVKWDVTVADNARVVFTLEDLYIDYLYDDEDFFMNEIE